MGFKSYKAHYLSKFPGCEVSYSDHEFDAYRDGEHLVHLEKDGGGMIQDRSEEQGCAYKHDLSPIPKNARAHKLYPNGNLGKAEEHKERHANGMKLAAKFDGRVPSIEELKKAGYEFDDKGNVKFKAEPQPAPAQQAPQC